MDQTAEKVVVPSRPIRWLVPAVLLFVTLAVVVLFLLFTLARTRRAGPSLPNYGQLPAFTLTNQMGRAVSLQDLRGYVWLADVIFTRCAGPCPRMTERWSQLQAALRSSVSVRLVSLTTDPEFDTPEVLKRYGERFGARPELWQFLTGDKREIARVAVQGLKLTAIEKSPGEQTDEADLFIHSTLSVLIDKHGRARAVFETLEPGFQHKAVDAINRICREP